MSLTPDENRIVTEVLRKVRPLVKTFRPAKVIDNQDPQMLGRIRCIPEQINEQDLQNSVYNFNPKKDKWTEKDPFVYLPFLPYFIYQVPKPDEYVQLLYSDPTDPLNTSRYYVQGPFSSPTTIYKENLSSAKTFLNSGIRNKRYKALKNQDGEIENPNTAGVYPEPGDNALLGRYNTDVITKDGEILFRAGQHKPFVNGQIPVANTERAFLQLSIFDETIQTAPRESQIKLIPQDKDITRLIEYTIINPENMYSALTGNVIIYNITPDKSNSGNTLAGNITPTSDLESYKSIQKILPFSNLSLGQVAEFINGVLQQVMEGRLSDGTPIINQYPFYYRSSTSLFSQIMDSDLTTAPEVLMNLLTLFPLIKPTDYIISNSGNGLIYDKKGSTTVPKTPKRESYTPKRIIGKNNTVAIMGAKQLYFLSHDTINPTRGKIQLDGTVYGIDQNRLVDEIQPKTSSFVRGEELLQLLSKIIEVLTTHVHPYPGLPPNPVTVSGAQLDALIKELNDAGQKILNKNIRLN